jgi:hypothetical protein
MAVITADTVESKLRKWQAGEVTTTEIHDWAENTYAVSASEPESDAVNEVLAQLDMLNMNLVTKDDIPALVAALRSKDFESLLEEHFATVDLNLRKSQLAEIPLYAPFCRSSE